MRALLMVGALSLVARLANAENELQVFDENTSFEKILANKQMLERQIASMTVSARVIAVRRELGLTTKESNEAPQDIVLNSGTQNGITEGMELSVQRRIPVLDPYRDNQQTELEIEFATIKVVKVQNDLAIARLEKMQPIHSGLSLGTRAIMIGDYVGKGR